MAGRRLRVAGAVIALLLLVSAVAVTGWRLSRDESTNTTVTRDVTIPFVVSEVPSSTLAAGLRRTVTPGRNGVKRHFTYQSRRYTNGRLREVTVLTAKRPRWQVVSAPTTEVVAVGTRPETVFEVNADRQAGLSIGRLPSSGVLRFRVSGSVTFAGARTVCGPYGNGTYRYYHAPLRRDVKPGALLLRLERGRWTSLKEIRRSGDVFEIRGRRGALVTAVVNDASGYFADNRGSFQLVVLSNAPSR